MKRIDKLTDEMRASFPGIIKEYTEAGLSCEPADWAASEKAIGECYQFTGLSAPAVYVRVGNPLVLALAAPVAGAILDGMHKHKAVYGPVYGAVSDAVDGAVKDAVKDAVGGAVGGAVKDAVDDAVRGAVDDAVGDAVDGPVYGAVSDAVSDAVDGAVKDAVGDAVGGAVKDAVDDAVRGAVDDAVYGAVGRAVKDSIYDAVGGAVKDAVDDAVRGAVSNAVGGAVDDAVRGAVRDAVSNAVKDSVYDAVNDSVYDAVRDAVGGAVGDAVGGAVRDAVYGAVSDAVSDAVDGAVKDAVGDAVGGAVKDAVGGAVRDAVGGAVKDAVRGAWWKYMGGRWWLAWDAYLAVYRRAGLTLTPDIWARADAAARAQRASGWWWPHRQFVMVCDGPERISLEAGRLHAEGRQAIRYRDGWGLWFLHGVRVSQTVAETRPEDMSREWLETHFIKEAKVEIRREILRRMGAPMFVHRMGAKAIDRQGEVYELLTVDLAGRTNAAKYLKMLNPSIGVWHVEAVPDNCRTVAEALHSRKPPALRALPISEDGAEWFQQGDVCIWPKSAKSVRPSPKVLT